MKKVQLAVIGGGPGGYAAAFHAADLGLEVTLIDMEKNPGGVCLYRGCIPSKALLHVAKLIYETQEAKKWGVDFGKPEINLDKLRKFKKKVVTKLTGGLGQLVKQRKINYIQGKASFLNGNTLSIELATGGTEELEFEKAILATGSVPSTIPGFPVNSSKIMSSREALELENIPEKLLILGGGYIGLEMGSVYSALGSEITVVEMMPQLLPGADADLVEVLTKSLQKKFKTILLNTKVVNMTETKTGVSVNFEGENVKEPEQKFDKVLIAVGRRTVTAGLGLENTKIKTDERGFVVVDEKQQTDEPSVFAIGDIVGGAMLAHKASAEGKVAVEAILGKKVAFEPAAIPAVVFTDPELAWTGVTENEAKERGINYKVTKFPWAASGRATTLDRYDGLTKLIFDAASGRVLGMGIVGPGAGELIAEGTLAVEMAALAKDVALSIHPHPTLSETVMESAELFFGHTTHLYKPKRN